MKKKMSGVLISVLYYPIFFTVYYGLLLLINYLLPDFSIGFKNTIIGFLSGKIGMATETALIFFRLILITPGIFISGRLLKIILDKF